MIANKHPINHCISREHPSLAGHFPGQPIVPGVLILNSVFTELTDKHPSWQLCGIKKLKFLQPLQPEQSFTISYDEIKNRGLRFKCWVDHGDAQTPDTASKTLLAEGHLKLKPARV